MYVYYIYIYIYIYICAAAAALQRLPTVRGARLRYTCSTNIWMCIHITTICNIIMHVLSSYTYSNTVSRHKHYFYSFTNDNDNTTDNHNANHNNIYIYIYIYCDSLCKVMNIKRTLNILTHGVQN